MSDPTPVTPASESAASSVDPSSPEDSSSVSPSPSVTPSPSASVPDITQADLDDAPETPVAPAEDSPFGDPLQGNDAVDPTSGAAGAPVDTPAAPSTSPDGSDAVDPTVSTDPSSETPSPDVTEPTPIFDSTVAATGTDPSLSPETSDSTSSDGTTSPSDDSSSVSPTTSSEPEEPAEQPDDSEAERPPLDPPIEVAAADQGDAPLDHDEHIDPEPEATPSNSAGVGDPTGTGSVLGKDGAGPSQNQPTMPIEDETGEATTIGPGVDPTVSLSPTATGGYTSDEDEGEISIEPTYVTPDIPEPDAEPVRQQRSFGTPIDPTFEAATTGYTPRFRATLRPNGVIEVQRADWIGPEVLTVDVDDVDELTGLLEGLAAQAPER